MKTYLKMAFANIFRNKKRSLATALSVIFGYCGLVVLSGYLIHTEAAIRTLSIYINNTGHILFYKKNGAENYFTKPGKYLLQENHISEINKILQPYQSEIEFTSKSLLNMGLLSNGEKSAAAILTGIDIDSYIRIKNHPMVKQHLSEFTIKNLNEDLSTLAQKNPASISLTENIAQIIGRPFPLNQYQNEKADLQLMARTIDGGFNAVDARLGATHQVSMTFASDTSVYLPIELLQNLLSTDGIAQYSLFLNPDISIIKIKKSVEEIQQQLIKNNLPIDVFGFYDEKVSLFYKGTLSFLMTMGVFIFFLILFAITLSILNTITMGVIERTKEIATLRAIGFRPQLTAHLFVIENAIITLFSLIIGGILSIIFATLINQAHIMFQPTGVALPIQFLVTPELNMSVLICLPIFILNCLTAYYVAINKTKQKISQLFADSGVAS